MALSPSTKGCGPLPECVCIEEQCGSHQSMGNPLEYAGKELQAASRGQGWRDAWSRSRAGQGTISMYCHHYLAVHGLRTYLTGCARL